MSIVACVVSEGVSVLLQTMARMSTYTGVLWWPLSKGKNSVQLFIAHTCDGSIKGGLVFTFSIFSNSESAACFGTALAHVPGVPLLLHLLC